MSPTTDATFTIRFDNLPVSEAGKKAEALRKELIAVQDVNVRLVKDDPSNQDFGATLVLVLGTPAVIALAQGAPPAIKSLADGIAAYLSRSRAKITIERNGKIIAEGVSGNDVAKITEALYSKS